MVSLSSVFGILGILVAGVLFLSPVTTIRTIVRNKNTLKFSQLPYLAQIVESSFWTLWSLTVPNRSEMLINNIIGVSFMSIYVIVFLYFVDKKNRTKAYLHVGVALILINTGLVVYLSVPQSTASLFLSVAAVVLNVVKYASPLSVAKLVIQTKSVQYMPLPLTLACLACSVLWGMYGILLNDYWIMIPNVAGVVCGVLQVLLWCYYHFASTVESDIDGGEQTVATTLATKDTKISTLEVGVVVPDDVA
jgi:solute carrier family 50 protein (sugar transporter)